MINSILQPISRKQFLIYSLIWFLCTGIILFFLYIYSYGFSLGGDLASLVTSNWWLVTLGWLVDIVLYYKRIKDIMEASYDEPNYYFLLVIPIVFFLTSIGGPTPILVPVIIAKILSSMEKFFQFALLIFLVLKKGKK